MRPNWYTLRAHVRLPYPETPGIEYHPVRRFPGYIIGTNAAVLSQKNGVSWRQLATRIIRGHVSVQLSRNGKTKMCWVHRLMLETFVGRRPPGKVCRHLDGNGANNVIANLAWGTCQENADDRDRHGTTARGERNGIAALTDAAVLGIKARLALGDHPAVIAPDFDATERTIMAINYGQNWRHIPSPTGNYPIRCPNG